MSKILIVDDSETLRQQLKKTLETAGHQVVEGEDGVHALETLSGNKDVKLVLCDVNMPRMDGISFSQKVHAQPEFQKLPIIMLTTETNTNMKAKGKEAGVLAWITKPYVDDKLLGAVDKVLKKAA